MTLGQRHGADLIGSEAGDANSLLPDADLRLYPPFLPAADAEERFRLLEQEVAFECRTIRMFGREIPEPRLVAWHGDSDASYTYSGRKNNPLPWTPTLLEIKARVESFTRHRFNSVLANFYRDGRDSMGFHSDDEKELGPAPVIASVSLGATRTIRFQARIKDDRSEQRPASISVELPSGSLLLMGKDVQRLYRHAIPKTKCAEKRINLTFRRVYS